MKQMIVNGIKTISSYGDYMELADQEFNWKPRFETQAEIERFYDSLSLVLKARREQEKKNPFPFDDELSLSQGSPYCNANLDVFKQKDMMIRYAVINDRIYVNSEDFLKELDSTNQDNEGKYDPEVANTFLEIMMKVSDRSADLGDADPLRVKIET